MTTTHRIHPGRFDDEPADGIDCLRLMLRTKTLDPTFEGYGNFLLVGEGIPQGHVRFWGNFFDRSFVFDLITDDRALIEEMTGLIRANQATEAYADAKEEQARGAAHWEMRRQQDEAQRQENRRREAMAFLGLDGELKA